MALGVGTSRILGKIHYAEMQIKDKFFPCSITVMEDDKVDFLFGLDMLKGHQVIAIAKLFIQTRFTIFNGT